MQLRSGWRISIGSSIVTMCWRRVRLISSSIAASVVVFPGSGGAGDEHEPTLLVREPSDAGGKMELVEARDLVRDDAKRERDRTALPEAVDAEARETRLRVGEVEVAGLEEALASVRDGCRDLCEHGLELGVAEKAEVDRMGELAVRSEAPAAARP